MQEHLVLSEVQFQWQVILLIQPLIAVTHQVESVDFPASCAGGDETQRGPHCLLDHTNSLESKQLLAIDLTQD